MLRLSHSHRPASPRVSPPEGPAAHLLRRDAREAPAQLRGLRARLLQLQPQPHLPPSTDAMGTLRLAMLLLRSARRSGDAVHWYARTTAAEQSASPSPRQVSCGTSPVSTGRVALAWRSMRRLSFSCASQEFSLNTEMTSKGGRAEIRGGDQGDH